MRRKGWMCLRLLTVFFAALLGTTVLQADRHEFDGTWVLNTAKSKSTSRPVWKSRTLKLSSVGDTRRFQWDGESVGGKRHLGGYEAKLDGKDYPVTGQVSGAETISLKQVSPGVVAFTMKKRGKV